MCTDTHIVEAWPRPEHYWNCVYVRAQAGPSRKHTTGNHFMFALVWRTWAKPYTLLNLIYVRTRTIRYFEVY